MKSIGAGEARTHFARLLREVASGASITITRRGVPAAVVSPPAKPEMPDARKAIDEWRRYRDKMGVRLGAGPSIREMIEEGRR